MIKLSEIASLLGGELAGDGETEISKVNGLDEAGEGDIAFLLSEERLGSLAKTKASCVVVPKGVNRPGGASLSVDDAHDALLKVVEVLYPERSPVQQGVDPRSIVEPGASIGEDVTIGPLTYVGEGAEIGKRTTIYPQVYVGREVKIGDDCLIYSQVIIGEKTEVGSRVTIHSGTVIGSDGFSFTPKHGMHGKIPSLGKVIIEDDVEMGANVTVDRATFGVTKIGRGTKLDDLVHIGHNVTIRENCLIVAQVGIGGSTTVGNNVVLAGQAGLVDHINIGDNVKIGAQAGVLKSIPPNTVFSGYPARPHQDAKKVHAATQKLPELFKRVQKLEEKLKGS